MAGMSCTSSTRTELRRLKLENSVEGQTALALAGILDAHQGAHGASGTADRLVKIMEALRARQPAQQTELDRIRDRRARRTAG